VALRTLANYATHKISPCKLAYRSPSLDHPSKPATSTLYYAMTDMSRGVRMCRNKSSLYLPFIYAWFMLLRVQPVSSVLVTLYSLSGIGSRVARLTSFIDYT
jgi:hypothetical protein